MNRISGSEKLYLVGFRIDPDEVEPQVYTLYVDCDRPILKEQHPILFVFPSLASKALSESDCGAAILGPVPDELYTVFDIADAFYTLEARDDALDSGLLDCINALTDFMPFFIDPMPEHYHSVLRRMADHLTFNLPFKEFIEEQGISRKTLTDAFYWSIGATIYSSKIIVQ